MSVHTIWGGLPDIWGHLIFIHVGPDLCLPLFCVYLNKIGGACLVLSNELIQLFKHLTNRELQIKWRGLGTVNKDCKTNAKFITDSQCRLASWGACYLNTVLCWIHILKKLHSSTVIVFFSSTLSSTVIVFFSSTLSSTVIVFFSSTLSSTVIVFLSVHSHPQWLSFSPDYTGGSCSLIKDSCSSDPCQNGGTCVTLAVGYTCRCAGK